MDWPTHARNILEQLGEDATYTPSGGGGQSTVRVMYQQPYREAFHVAGNAPNITCMAADVPGVKRGATFALRGLTLRVSSVEPEALSAQVLCHLEKIGG